MFLGRQRLAAQGHRFRIHAPPGVQRHLPQAGTHAVTGTEERPFWSVTRNTWVSMSDLEVGETLSIVGGQTATVAASRIEHLATPVTVYDFEVADWHTYHVGTADTGWVYVHNQCVPRIRSDALGRPKSAYMKVTQAHLGNGTGTNAVTRAAARAAGNATDDAGHLIGRLLGGPGGKNAGNWVPQNPAINRGAFRSFEQQIANEVRAGHNVHIRVTPRYQGAATRPYQIKYQVRVNGTSWEPRRFGN